MPSRAGTVSGILVADGQQVREGQRLAVVRAEESMIAGATAPARIRDALGQQDVHLADQGRLLLEAAGADQARLTAQIDGDRAAIRQLESQRSYEKELIATAEADYRNAIEVAKGGFISKRDIQDRQATALSRRQQLAQLEQSLSDKRAEIAQAQRAIVQAAMTAQAQAANAQSGRAALSQQLAEADLATGYALTSPVNGVVTALTARLGQPAATDQQLMLVVPAHSRMGVELYVPTTAAGFLALGQEVRLSVDAFPYQTFGTIKAKVTAISGAAIPRPSAAGTVPVYLVTASIAEPWVTAFGRRQPLVPGMTLSARIITERRSLIEWLFEPLFAVRRR
jgi:membrane fusion protein